jgi:hypothetical protein
VNRYLFALLAVILSVTLVPAAWCSESSLLDNDFLDDDSGSSFRNLMNDLSSDEHLSSMSFSNLMDVLSSDEHLDSVSFNNIDDVINDSNDSSDNDTGNTTTEEDEQPDEIVLLNEGADGENNNGSTSAHTNNSVVGHTDSNYWRAWRAASENQRKQAIYEGTYAPEKAITLESGPWSFTYWAMNHCGLAYHRTPITGANALKNEQQARDRKFMLSPLEAYDTWHYNVHGKNPHTAAWEAVNHNTGKDGTRKNEDTDEYAQYWILKSDLKKIGPTLPFKLNMPDGRVPEQRNGQDPLTVQYTLTVGRATHNEVPGQVRYAEPRYFGSKLVEEFHLPVGAVQELGIRGMDVKYTVWEFDDKGYPVKNLGKFSWNEIQSNPRLKRNHVAQQPDFIRLFRSVNEEEGSYGQTINWYYILRNETWAERVLLVGTLWRLVSSFNQYSTS